MSAGASAVRPVPTVVHGHAGAAHQTFNAIALHEDAQLRPQHQHHPATTPFGRRAGPPQFGQLRAQARQAHEVELAVAVQAAHAARRSGCQHPVGAHHLRRLVLAWHGAHQQVFTVRVKHVHIQARRRARGRLQARAHLLHKHAPAQGLRGLHLVGMAGPQRLQLRRGLGALGVQRHRHGLRTGLSVG